MITRLTQIKVYLRNMLFLIFVFTFYLRSYGQNIVDVMPQDLEYWTGRVDWYLKLDGDIKAGSGALNNFAGWAVFDITKIPDNASITSITIWFHTTEASTSSKHCLEIGRIYVDPRTAKSAINCR